MSCSEVLSGRPPGYTECPRSDRTSAYQPYRTVYVHRVPFTLYNVGMQVQTLTALPHTILESHSVCRVRSDPHDK
jgi:hypothetical protein